MRLLFQRVPEKNQEIDFVVHDPGPDLLVAPERTALQLVDREIQFAFEQRARRAGRKDFVMRQQVAVEFGPFDQIALLVVVRDQRDFLVRVHRDCFVGHGEK